MHQTVATLLLGLVDVSIPNKRLRRNEGKIVIPISNGKIVLKDLDVILKELQDKTNVRDSFRKKGADVLCEVGIGLNDKIQEATGITLIDEKMGGTSHVAFGDNTFFGGSNTSDVHMDMIMQSPTITINGKQIMDKGTLLF